MNSFSKQSLIELKKAVEAGDTTVVKHAIVNNPKVYFPEWLVAGRIMEGSVDAAISLLKAVSNGICQFSIINDPTCTKATCCIWPNGLSGDEQHAGEGWDEGNGSRALLLAILDALIDKEFKP